jgi:hypothetical protein
MQTTAVNISSCIRVFVFTLHLIPFDYINRFVLLYLKNEIINTELS